MQQVWVGVVPVGPKGTALNSSYQNRDSREYKEDLGYAVVNFARMVPDGLLVFFPSYGVLKSCTDFWKNTSVGGSGKAHTHATRPTRSMQLWTQDVSSKVVWTRVEIFDVITEYW